LLPSRSCGNLPSVEGRRPPRKSAYHHGDLRTALIRSAAALVNDRGLAGVSLREVARRAGVSHAAPYHHFSSKESLLAALAAEGFADLDAALARAESRAGADPRARLEALGVAYVRFALAKPEMFRAMFRASAKDVGSGGPLGRLLRGVRDCLAASPSPARDPTSRRWRPTRAACSPRGSRAVRRRTLRRRRRDPDPAPSGTRSRSGSTRPRHEVEGAVDVRERQRRRHQLVELDAPRQVAVDEAQELRSSAPASSPSPWGQALRRGSPGPERRSFDPRLEGRSFPAPPPGRLSRSARPLRRRTRPEALGQGRGVRAVGIGEGRELRQEPGAQGMPECVQVSRVGRGERRRPVGYDHPCDGEPPGRGHLEGQEGVVHGAEGAPGHDEER
jgi:AcrR family transcriptional regulator